MQKIMSRIVFGSRNSKHWIPWRFGIFWIMMSYPHCKNGARNDKGCKGYRTKATSRKLMDSYGFRALVLFRRSDLLKPSQLF